MGAPAPTPAADAPLLVAARRAFAGGDLSCGELARGCPVCLAFTLGYQGGESHHLVRRAVGAASTTIVLFAFRAGRLAAERDALADGARASAEALERAAERVRGLEADLAQAGVCNRELDEDLTRTRERALADVRAAFVAGACWASMEAPEGWTVAQAEAAAAEDYPVAPAVAEVAGA
jgi:hypothetical protein